MRPSMTRRITNPQAVGESPHEKPRAVRDQAIDSHQASLAQLIGSGFDLPESLAVEFEQAAREGSHQQAPAIFQQDGHGLSVAIGPAITFKTFSVENDQSLRARAYEEFGIEDAD